MKSLSHTRTYTYTLFVSFFSYRFLQTAEMLKPSSTTIMDQDYVEYYPHIVLLHNKAELQDFMPTTLNKMKVLHICIAS